MLEGCESPAVTVYLGAILGLLLVSQYYQMQIMAGRILAIDWVHELKPTLSKTEMITQNHRVADVKMTAGGAHL